MGKRELLIIAGFLLAGAIAYHFTAPAGTGNDRRFSLSRVLTHVRSQVRGNRVTATVTSHNTLPVPAAAGQLRVSGVSKLTITGENRADLEYELTVEANGEDDAAARQAGQRTTVSSDDLGGVLALHVVTPRNTRQVVRLALHLPARLAARVEGASGSVDLEASGMASLFLDSVVGDVRITGITGEVTGTHRNGDLHISDSGKATLTLVSSKARFERIRGPLTVTARNGECHVDASGGLLTIDATNENTSIAHSAAAVRVTGSGGELHLDTPAQDVNVDMRRTPVTIQLDAAVPVTALAADAPLRLELAGPPAVAIDAATTENGTITAVDFALTATTTDQGTRLTHAFGAATARVVLRNQRSEIVIAERK